MFLIDILAEASKEAKLLLDEEEGKKGKRRDQETCVNRLQAEPMNAPKRERSKRNIKRVRTDFFHDQKVSDDVYMPELEAEEDSDDEEEIKKTSKKKGKKITTKRIKAMADCGPIPQPGLPQEFKNRMLLKAEAEGGVLGEEILVIQKAITMSDIQSQQNRFSIPEKKLLNTFLTDNELSFLKGRNGDKCNTMVVDIIEPSGLVKEVRLSRWEMLKGKGAGVSRSFVLKGNWKKVVSNNHLQIDDMAQLWAFRIDGRLCLAFVLLSDEEKEQQGCRSFVGNTSAVCTDNNQA